jgi:hypothetical protein
LQRDSQSPTVDFQEPGGLLPCSHDFEPGSHFLLDEISVHPLFLFNYVLPSAPRSYKVFWYLRRNVTKEDVRGSELIA